MISKRLTRGQAIKKYCKESCCAGSIPDWKECPATHCYLWNFRLGRETLAKPFSFKKQRKTRMILPKNSIVMEGTEPKINASKEEKTTLSPEQEFEELKKEAGI